MFRLEVYQLPKSQRWRWKLMYNNRCLARADYHYATKPAAKKAFENMLKGVLNQIANKGQLPAETVDK